jgi:hypothetical protein
VKLLTEMQDGCVHAMGYCVDPENVKPLEVARLEHDAAAAHALVMAIDELDPAAAIVKHRADELMREWGYEQSTDKQDKVAP